jgi:hypothetical protein
MLVAALDTMYMHLKSMPYAAQRCRACRYSDLASKIDAECVTLAAIFDEQETIAQAATDLPH